METNKNKKVIVTVHLPQREAVKGRLGAIELACFYSNVYLEPIPIRLFALNRN